MDLIPIDKIRVSDLNIQAESSVRNVLKERKRRWIFPRRAEAE